MHEWLLLGDLFRLLFGLDLMRRHGALPRGPGGDLEL